MDLQDTIQQEVSLLGKKPLTLSFSRHGYPYLCSINDLYFDCFFSYHGVIKAGQNGQEGSSKMDDCHNNWRVSFWVLWFGNGVILFMVLNLES